ncbi:MAG: PLDc N-terminal domain-containing protein [Actinomycetes bacterium]
MARKSWRDLPARDRRLIGAAGLVQSVLLLLAQVDVSRRPAGGVRGPKWVWRLACLVNFVGPAAYFLWGRTRTGATTRR